MIDRDYVSKLENTLDLLVLEKGSFQIYVSLFGGRIIQAKLNNEFLLWTHPNLLNSIKNIGWNLGGIRTWFSPERNYYYKNPIDFKDWFCPKGFDPIKYTLKTKTQNAIVVQTDLFVRDNISQKDITGSFTKRISLGDFNSNEDYSSGIIEINSSLTIDQDNPIAIWTIFQVPPGDNYGIVSIPVKHYEPIHYFDIIPEKYLYQLDNQAIAILDGRFEFKVGIQPKHLEKNRSQILNYNYSINKKRFSIIIESKKNPSNMKECIDTAKFNPLGPKGSIQIYNSNSNVTDLC
ncbi:MAG: hypothetical protein ACFFDW_16635, partial [Candidatus Thorarchaeota archaeon]